MSERRLEALLRSTPLPDEEAAEERAWNLVRAAHARAERSTQPSNTVLLGRRRWGLAAVLVAAAVAAAATAAVQHAIAPSGTARPQAALSALPTGGDVLVSGANGSWIVHADGTKRRLGAYVDATWSPHGLYVAAAQGRELLALDPQGHVHWTITRAQRVRLPAWSPAPTPLDTRIAYLAGTTLHVVGGDSRGDRAIARDAALVQPAWQPRARFVLAFATARTVNVYAVDPLRLLWRTRVPETPTELTWSDDGARLLALAPHAVRIFSATGRLVARDDPSDATVAAAAAFAPRSHEPFEARVHGAQTSVFSLATGRTVFTAPGEIRDLAFSPDGRWLLLGWRSADRWLFLRRGTTRVVDVANVARAFDSNAFPRLAGWCCGS